MIEGLSELDLNSTDEAAIAQLLRDCFPTDYGGRSFFQQRPQHRLIWREGGILAHLALFYRAIRLGDNMVDVLGVGDVATAPVARSRGLATALLDHAIRLGGTTPAQFMILFGARGLYDRAGFSPETNALIHVDMTGAKTESVHHDSNAFLKVRPLAGRNWPKQDVVDFLGPLF